MCNDNRKPSTPPENRGIESIHQDRAVLPQTSPHGQEMNTSEENASDPTSTIMAAS